MACWGLYFLPGFHSESGLFVVFCNRLGVNQKVYRSSVRHDLPEFLRIYHQNLRTVKQAYDCNTDCLTTVILTVVRISKESRPKVVRNNRIPES